MAYAEFARFNTAKLLVGSFLETENENARDAGKANSPEIKAKSLKIRKPHRSVSKAQ